MGFRGAIKSGGGFWNGVDGEFVGYHFETFTSKKGEEFVSFVPSMRIDGSEAPGGRSILLGYAENFVISSDLLSLAAADGGNVTIPGGLPAGKFFDSLVVQGEAVNIESVLPDLEAGEPLNLERMIGARIRLVQQNDPERDKTSGKRKDKNGKEWPNTDTVVAAVYSLPTAGKSNGTKAPAAKAAPKGKTADTGIRDKADAAVIALCEAAVDKKNPQGTIPTTKLSVGVLRLLSGDKDKEAVRKMVNDAAYLAEAVERGVFAYDSDENTVSLAE